MIDLRFGLLCRIISRRNGKQVWLNHHACEAISLQQKAIKFSGVRSQYKSWQSINKMCPTSCLLEAKANKENLGYIYLTRTISMWWLCKNSPFQNSSQDGVKGIITVAVLLTNFWRVTKYEFVAEFLTWLETHFWNFENRQILLFYIKVLNSIASCMSLHPA